MDTFLQVIIAAVLFVLTMVIVNRILKLIHKQDPQQDQDLNQNQDPLYKRIIDWFNSHRKQ